MAELLADHLRGLEAFGFDQVEIAQMFPDDERFGALFPDLEPEHGTIPAPRARSTTSRHRSDETQSATHARLTWEMDTRGTSYEYVTHFYYNESAHDLRRCAGRAE